MGYDDQQNHHIQENMIYDCIQHLALVEDLLVILGVLCAFSEEKLSNLRVVLGQECKIWQSGQYTNYAATAAIIGRENDTS